MRKISVIMASFLGDYPNAAKNRDKKFVRAVNTFLKQTYENKELIIVCDGCTKTYEMYEEKFKQYDNIECVFVPKQELYSGEIRTEGLKYAKGDIICYLDNDDVLGKTHLETIESQFTDDVQWVYYDDYLVLSKDFKELHKRTVEPRWGSIGTSSIAHKNIGQDKLFSDGYGHDFLCVMKLACKGLNFKKLEKAPSYLVCHWGDMRKGGGDF